ncbi:DUF6916 family protein (plasmid) [Ralstonia sp. 25C]|uniref:DUF6916 family protein n=1 Tax=Ralstonia sp. 25C TaxID=3447363 RepID=UPI003F74C916
MPDASRADGATPSAPDCRSYSIAPMTVSAELFLPHVGTAFFVHNAEGDASDPPFTLSLDEVASATTASAGGQAFSLFFQGRGVLLLQGTYFLRHAVLPEQLMFLVPIAGSRDGYRYQACFNLA